MESVQIDISTMSGQKRGLPTLLHGPETLSNGFEVSVHSIPRLFRGELEIVLPGIGLEGMLLVPTAQKAALELVNWGPDAAREKDLLLERFAAWANAVCTDLASSGHWADYVDPCSGLPVRSRACSAVYPEVDAFETLLRWRTSSAGGCRVLLHPTWGAAVYPASLFARAPLEVVRQAMERAAASVPLIAEPVAGGNGSVESF